MKTLNKAQWELYKGSQWYKDAIADFENLLDAEPKSMMQIAMKYDAPFFTNTNKAFVNDWCNILSNVENGIKNILQSKFKDDNPYNLYEAIQCMWAGDGQYDILDDVPQSAFKVLIGGSLFYSMVFHKYFPEYFIPNFYVMRFNLLQNFADSYDIELPSIPARARYKDRCLYYVKICELLQEFRHKNKMSPAELCALLYDYTPRTMEQEGTISQGNYHNIWILCGNKWGKEKTANNMFWQASEETRKGDVMLFYEKYPVKAITGIWQAQADGMADPFFHYYGFTYIGNEIQMPHITLDEMKADEHFKEVNFVRKNFQDVSGWQVTHKDYNLLLQMWAAKGVDTSKLPQPFIPPVNDWSKVLDKGKKIKEIADIEEHIIVPFLADLGLERHIDYERQVTLHLGHDDKGRTDFSLFPFGDNKKYARVVIEAKRKQDNILQETFNQARSYADLQQADLLLIIDEQEVNAYSRCGKDNLLDFRNRQTFYWHNILNDADIHAQLTKMILTYK